MEHIQKQLEELEGKIILHGADPITRYGFTQVPNAVLRNKNLSPGAKLTYADFLSYAWHQQSAFPGQKKLSEDLGVSERHVRRFISELKKEKLLSVERRGLGKTNIYHLYVVVDNSHKHKK